MANTHSALAPVNFMPKVQDYLNRRLVATEISNTSYRSKLTSGQTIDFPYTTDMRVQTYTPGTDLTIDNNVATSNTMSIDQSRAATFTLDPNQQAQAEDKTMNATLASQGAYVIANDIDQKLLKEGVDSAANTVAGGALTAATIYGKLTDGMATLQRANATDRPLFAVLDPERCALLAQVEVANGFNLADSALKNGFVGKSQAGFSVYNSNNLPTTSVLTMATQPSNTDTITVCGVTWTWVTDGTAANAGEINIGANVADAKAILVTALNGTTPPAADDYIEISVENRRKYQHAGLSAATFSGDDCTITAYGKQNNSETFTDLTDGFAAETGSCLLGAMGSISLGMQIQPTMVVAQEPARPEKNYMIHTLYGKKVFYRDAYRLVDFTITV